MPKIRKDVIQTVIDRARIEDVVGDFVKLRKAGVNMTGICPFHNDKHDGNFIVRPSTISEAKGGNTYKCFACNAKGGPVQFLMNAENMTFPDAIRWLGQKYGIIVDDVPIDWTPPPPKPAPPPLKLLSLPMEMVKRTQDRTNDNLCNWLRSIKWDAAQRARVEKVLRAFMVGHSDKDSFGRPLRDGFPDFTIFWQVDENGVIRTAKMIRYKTNGHRVKKEENRYNTDWIHSRLYKNNVYNNEEFNEESCYFGMHLLNLAPNATINIVESEKTALFMSICYGGMERNLWMACGGKTNISREKLKPLIEQRRDIFLYPDHDGIDEWKEQAKMIGYPNLYVNTKFDAQWWRPEDGEKADIADILYRLIQGGNDKVESTKVVGDVLEEMAKTNPALQQLIDTFDLQRI